MAGYKGMKHHLWTEEEKEFIRCNYTGNKTSITRISQSIGHPETSVKGQIYKLGLGLRIDHKSWSPEEKERLAELITQYHIAKVAQILKRSINSVAVKVQIMKLSRRIRDGYFTQKEVAQLLGVDSHWVHDRITRGELKAEPIMGYIPSNGGSRWKVEEKDIRKFITEHASSITGRNVDISLLVYIFEEKE